MFEFSVDGGRTRFARRKEKNAGWLLVRVCVTLAQGAQG